MYQAELNPGGVNEEFGGILSPVGEVFRSLMEFYHDNPCIAVQIVSLQDAHARRKKRERLRDERAIGQAQSPLMGWDEVGHRAGQGQPGEGAEVLGSGRPRMHPQNVFLLAMVRACTAGSHSRLGWSMMVESVSVRALLHASTKHFPARTTVLENINLMDEETLLDWQQKHLHWIGQQEGSDAGWEQITVDSTSIEGAAAFPVDSVLLVKVTGALWRNFCRFYDSLDIKVPVLPKVRRWLTELRVTSQRISMGSGKKKAAGERRRWYRQMVEQTVLLLNNLQKVAHGLLEQEVLCESRLSGKEARHHQRCARLLRDCRSRCIRILQQINERVLVGGRVAAVDKLLSLCDNDAAIIVKGGREAVFGYKAQLAFNQPGYCTAALLNQGNGSDSQSLEAVVRRQNDCSGIIATKVSVDDGYAGSQTAGKLAAAGVCQLSVSGAKGKRQAGEELWQEESMRALRQWRPAAEARIFIFKQNQQLRRFARFGRNAAITDLLSKVLIFNTDCLLRRKAEKARPPQICAA